MEIKALIDGVLRGDRRSIAKMITFVEDNPHEARRVISQLYPHTGNAYILGITGPTGSGKSTLIGRLAQELRRQGKTVGIIVVDPTSPFTGGAFLGDRIRMQELSTDAGIFIRSMATRGGLGGLARSTKDAVKILDASGKDVIIVETVGAGQSEVNIIRVAHTVVVVLAPGMGNEIQAIKAGIMEIGDIFVVNKADRDDANKTVMDVKAMLETSPEKSGWKPPVVKTVAITGEGITELLNRIDRHREYLKTGALDIRRRKMVEMELIEAIKQKVTESILHHLKQSGKYDTLIRKILTKEIDPYSAIDTLLAWPLKVRKTKESTSNSNGEGGGH